MYLFKSLFYLFIFIFGISKTCCAQNELYIKKNTEYFPFTFKLLEVFEDKTGRLNFDEIRRQKFIPCTKKLYNSGYNNSKFWYRIRIRNEAAQNWIFNCGGTLVDEIEFYEIFENGTIKNRISGDNYPQSSRELNGPTFGFNMYMADNESRTLIIGIESEDTKMFNFRLYSPKKYKETSDNQIYAWFFYYGMLFMMAFYNLLLYFSARDKTYIFYVFYIISFGLFQFTIIGFGNRFIWGEWVWFGKRASTIFTGLSTIFITLFSYNFLNIKVLYSKVKIYYLYLILSGLLLIGLSMPRPTYIFNYFTAIVSLINITILIIIGSIVWLKGYKPARYYMLAWGILFLTITIFILNSTKIMPSNPINFTVLPFGCILEVAIFSFALGKRITTIEKEKTNAQLEVVKQLKNNELVRNRIARDLHDDLGSTLSSINILSEFAKVESKNHPEKLPSILNKIASSTQKIQENLQDIVWTTQNKEDKIDNLLTKMRLFGGEVMESKNIDYQIDIDKNLNNFQLNADTHYDIFMIYKETINNIVKYSKATNVSISIKKDKENFLLKIVDNGIGFDNTIEKPGNGLKNMKHRAENIEGQLSIFSENGKGAQVILTLPVTHLWDGN